MSPRRADPALSERRRGALVRAGYAEILDKGVQAVTIDSVVARAGSSKGGALYYFPTKEDLLFAVLEWLFTQLNSTLDEVVRAQDSPRKVYRVLFDFLGMGVHNDRFRGLFAAFFDRCRERDKAIVVEGIRQRQFRPVKPEDAAGVVRALVDGYCLQWLMGEEKVPLETYRDRCRAVLGSYLLR